MIKNILIDDIREPGTCGIPKDAFVCRNPREGMYYLEIEQWDNLYLDHDLGCFHNGKEITGMTVLNWLEENPAFRPTRIHIVTSNAAVLQKMKKIVERMENEYET